MNKPEKLINFSTGYAKNITQSANPSLWKGLVGAWMPSMGRQGITLTDFSKYGRVGVLNNMDPSTDYINTINGYALTLDGANDFIHIGNIREINDATRDISISIWAKTSAASTNCFWYYDNNDALSPGTDAYLITPGNLAIGGIGTTGQINTGVSVNDGLWHHIVVVLKITSLILYVDNKVAFSTTVAHNHANYSTTLNFRIGDNANVAFFNGDIGDTLLYNRALSPSEIKDLYIGKSPLEEYILSSQGFIVPTEVLVDLDTDIRISSLGLIDLDTDIRIQLEPQFIDISTDIRAAGEVFIDLDTDIRANLPTYFVDLATDIRAVIENLIDIDTDIRIQLEPQFVDLDADIRAVGQGLVNLDTDIRIKVESFVDLDTDIRAAGSLTVDLDTDIRAVFEGLVDLDTDIRAKNDPDNSQIQVISTFFQEGEYLSSNTVTIEMEVYGAVKMQFRNENEAVFSALETYDSIKSNFNLSPGDGTKQVFLRFQDILGNLSNGQHVIEAVVNTSAAPAVTIEGYEDNTATTAITEAAYQVEDTPFFRWQIPIFAIPYEGFSYAIDEAPDDTINLVTPNIVRDGMIVSKKTPLPEMTIETTAGAYYFDTDIKDYSAQEFIIQDGGVQDRIDVVYVSGTSESLNIQQGVEAASPVKPDIPEDGIELATLYVPAGTTAIADVILTDTRQLFVELFRFEDEPLEPGQHTFQVKGLMSNGTESAVDTFDIWVANASPAMGEIFGYTDGTKTIQIFNGIYQTAIDSPYLEWTAAPAEPGPITYRYTTDGTEPTALSSGTAGTSIILGPFPEGITTIKIKPFDDTTGFSGPTKEFNLVFGSTTFTNDTAVIGGSTILKQSLKEVQVKEISWDFDSARRCVFYQSVLFDDTLPFSEDQTITVVYGASNETLFRGKIKQIERTIDIRGEGVTYHCVGPRGDLNECFATIDDPDFGETAQIVFEDELIADVVTTIVSKAPETVKNIQSLPTGANITDDFIAMTIAQVLESVYARTKYRWYMSPEGSLISVDMTATNPEQAVFGVYGTTVNSITPQYNVMANNLTFDTSRRYKTAVIEGSRKRELVRLQARCGAPSVGLNTLVDDSLDASEEKYKIFTLDSKWPVVKVIETFVTYARLKRFVLIPTISGLSQVTKFTIIFLESTICKSNQCKTTEVDMVTRLAIPTSISVADGVDRQAAIPNPIFHPPTTKTFEEVQGSLGPNNTIRFSKSMYSFWPTGVSFNTTTGIEVTPGININQTYGVPNYFWRNPPKKRCASVSADVLIETTPIKATVTVSGTANTNKVLRIVRTEFKYDEDPDSPRDDTAKMIEFAEDALQKFKDVKVRGSITLDTVDTSWNLDNTVNLINTQQGSWSTLNAKVVGISFDFDENTTTLEITNEYLK